MLRLGVNIDHVATVRNARGTPWPDPLRAALLAEDAARRQEATRFQASADDAEDGGANLAPPQIEQGKTRAQAARMVTGRASYTTLERIGRLETHGGAK